MTSSSAATPPASGTPMDPPDFLAAGRATYDLYPRDVAFILDQAFMAAHERMVDLGEPVWYQRNAPVSRAARRVLTDHEQRG